MQALKLLLPKGRIEEGVSSLLAECGLSLRADERSYRPRCSDPGIVAKRLKPQNIPKLVELGRHDCGFSGRDWIRESDADVVELLDLGLDPVRIVAAVPEPIAAAGWRGRPLVVASEYTRLAADFIRREGLDAVLLQSWGATEALPPEDADMIIDNTATGSTLRMNRLEPVAELMQSTTCFFASRAALSEPGLRRRLEELVLLMRSALAARDYVLLEMNVGSTELDGLVDWLPALDSPTVMPLSAGKGYAVKTAVRQSEVSRLIPGMIARGARDILQYRLQKIVSGTGCGLLPQDAREAVDAC